MNTNAQRRRAKRAAAALDREVERRLFLLHRAAGASAHRPGWKDPSRQGHPRYAGHNRARGQRRDQRKAAA